MELYCLIFVKEAAVRCLPEHLPLRSVFEWSCKRSHCSIQLLNWLHRVFASALHQKMLIICPETVCASVCVCQSVTDMVFGVKNIMLKRFLHSLCFITSKFEVFKWMLLWFTENADSFNTRPLTGLFFFMNRGYFSQLALITKIIISLIPRSHFSVTGRVWLFFFFLS